MNEFISLPQLKIFMTKSDAIDQINSIDPSEMIVHNNTIVLVAGGRSPSVDWLRAVAVHHDVWCIDHGVDICRHADIVPKFLIGDLDSAQIDSIDWAKEHNVPIERHPVDKDFTDTQLAINRTASIDRDVSIILTGAFGGRLDHMFSTLFTCANSSVKIFLADDHEIVTFVRGGESLRLIFDVKPIALSLLPITSTCIVSIDGVHWPLEHSLLKQNFPDAVSNRIESDIVNVSIDNGIVAVCLEF